MSERAAAGGLRRRILTLPVAIVSAITAALGIAGPAEADGHPDRPVEPRPGRAAPDTAPDHARAAGGTAAGGEYVVVPGDTIAAIAARYRLRTADLLARNGLSWSSTVFPGQRLALGERSASPEPIPADGDIRHHLVAPGDTVAGIAEHHGLPLADLLAANGLAPSSAVFPGESIVLPSPIDDEPA